MLRLYNMYREHSLSPLLQTPCVCWPFAVLRSRIPCVLIRRFELGCFMLWWLHIASTSCDLNVVSWCAVICFVSYACWSGVLFLILMCLTLMFNIAVCLAVSSLARFAHFSLAAHLCIDEYTDLSREWSAVRPSAFFQLKMESSHFDHAAFIWISTRDIEKYVSQQAYKQRGKRNTRASWYICYSFTWIRSVSHSLTRLALEMDPKIYRNWDFYSKDCLHLKQQTKQKV